MRWQILRDQRGSSEAVGFMAMIPLVLLTTLLVLQVSMFGYTLVVAESAARDAARAAAVGGDMNAAVERVMRSTGIRMTVVKTCDATNGIVQVDLWANTPALVRKLQSEQIHRWAVMQLEGGC